MVSIDHFRQELAALLSRAVRNGRLDVLINSGELCRSIRNGGAFAATCCDAMEAEMKTGDTLLVERSNGAGMTVRYLLPRRTN
jgi:UDP-N-acetylmuramyl pentapeptide synthase